MLRNTLNTFITATFIMLLGVSSTAQAVVPANTRITSTTTLELSDGKTLIESVTVTVDLQRSKPEIALKEVTVDGVPLEGDLGDVQWLHGKTKTLTYKYTITAKANGPAKYSVDTTVTNAGLKQEAGKKVDCKNFSCQDFSLGATAALERAETGAKVITVPNAGEGEYQSPTMVNGLEKGDIIFVNGETYEVGKVTMGDQEQLTNKIRLVSPLLTDVAVGDLIAEQEEFTVLLRKVVLDAAAENNMSQEGITITVSQPDHPDLDVIRNQDKFTVMEPRGPEMRIYVRNLSGEDGANPDPASEGLKTKTYPEIGGNIYFSTHDEPRHSPGDILEYLVTVRAGNEGPLTDQEYQIPNTPFLDYEGDLRLNNDSQLATPFRPVTVLLANDVENSPNTVDIDTIAYVTYQVTVMGGVGDSGERGEGERPAVASETYIGCLLVNNEGDPRGRMDVHCKPDGTNWESIRTAVFEMPDWPELDGLTLTSWQTACWCEGAENPAEYCDGEGWVVGKNRWAKDDPDHQMLKEALARTSQSIGWFDGACSALPSDSFIIQGARGMRCVLQELMCQ